MDPKDMTQDQRQALWDAAGKTGRDFRGRFIKGNHYSLETEFKLGQGFWRGKKRDENTKQKIRMKLLGRKLSEEHRLKVIKTLSSMNNQWGDKNPSWKGGIYKDNCAIRTSPAYKRWVRAIKKTSTVCVLCGSIEKLQADHIKPFAQYPSLRFELSNGRVLCWNCHKQTESYGRSIYESTGY